MSNCVMNMFSMKPTALRGEGVVEYKYVIFAKKGGSRLEQSFSL